MAIANKYTDIVVTIADGVGTIKVSLEDTRSLEFLRSSNYSQKKIVERSK
jgi:hypothetical protein